MEVDEDTDLSEYTFDYSLTVPIPVTATNGLLHDDGKTVSRSYSLDRIVNNTIEMTVTYEKP